MNEQKWKHLIIRPDGFPPYFYPIESLSYKPGMLFQMIRDWSDLLAAALRYRGIDVTIVLAKSYSSPLL